MHAKTCTLIIAIVFAATVGGCATYGNKTVEDPAKYVNIQEGKSTKSDVYRTFGQPHDVVYSDNGERSVWTYFKIQSSPNGWSYVPYVGVLAGGTNEDVTKVYFFFDAAGLLNRRESTKMSDSENSWAGMARMASQGNRDERAQHVEEEMKRLGVPFDKKAAHRVKFVK